MISALKWVPRGAAAEFPTKVDLDEDEMNRIAQLAQEELDDAKLDLQEVDESAQPPVPHNQDPDDEYDMANYDNDEDSNDKLGAIANVRGLAYHGLDEDDQYLTLPNDQELQEEREELHIDPKDNLVLATRTEDDVSYLEVYVYDDASEGPASLYVHHDIMLPSFPLTVEWISTHPGEPGRAGNFAAIGTFEPEIEIWDLDVIDGVYPTAILGQIPKDKDINVAKGTGKKKKKLRKANPDYHVDAVLSLAANPHHVNLLASGSADTTVKLWDLNTGNAVKSFEHHTSKVSSVAWNPLEATVLLSGGYDHYARVADLRAADVAASARKYKVEGDVENIRWHRNGHDFFVATDRGSVYKFDARSENKPVWTLQAHDSEITAFDVNTFVDDFMVTGSVDKRIKLWNLSNDSPSMLLSRDLDIGKVFSVQFAPDAEVGGIVAAAGSEGKLKVWNAFGNKTIRESVAKGFKGSVREDVVTAVEGDDESGESDDEPEMMQEEGDEEDMSEDEE